jgi:hypothetical protein
LSRSTLATAFLLSALAPAYAEVSTVFDCPSSGNNGNHDAVFNGFFVENIAADNLHSATLYYRATQGGLYNLTLTVHRNSYSGPVVASASQAVSLSNSSDKAVTWDFGDAPFASGSTLYFTHTQSGGGGTVQYNMQPGGTCPRSQESVGTSAVLNGFNVAVQLTTNTVTAPTGCVANATTLCIDANPGDRRFQVRVTYSTSQSGGLSGNGKAISLAPLGVSQGGLFWFFSADNPEMLVKILNGCTINNRFWVFVSAGTNVGFRLTVTDTLTGNSKTYQNPDRTNAVPVQDTSALSCQ